MRGDAVCIVQEDVRCNELAQSEQTVRGRRQIGVEEGLSVGGVEPVQRETRDIFLEDNEWPIKCSFDLTFQNLPIFLLLIAKSV